MIKVMLGVATDFRSRVQTFLLILATSVTRDQNVFMYCRCRKVYESVMYDLRLHFAAVTQHSIHLLSFQIDRVQS